jgi:hypothetical protein
MWAAPALGGVTATDPDDLIALAVLVPVWRWMRVPARARTGRGDLPLRIVAVTLAVLATSATSSDGEVGFGAGESEVFVSTSSNEVYVSRDAGVTWNRTRERSVPDPSSLTDGDTSVCIATGCWRVTDDGLFRTTDGGDPVRVDLPIDLATVSWSSVRLVPVTVDDVEYVVAWYRYAGAARLGPDDEVVWRSVDDFDRGRGLDWWSIASVPLMLVAPLVMLASSPAARRAAQRRGLRPNGVEGLMVVAALGLLGVALVSTFVLAPLLGRGVLPLMAFIVAVPAGCAVAWAWVAGGRRPKQDPPAPPGPVSGAPGDMPPPDVLDRVG